MDIELPHHSIETKRDFFIHLFTITCGLLIALALEGLVEWTHHRALVHEARTTIRRELQANEEAAAKNIRHLAAGLAAAKANLATEQRLARQPKDFHGSLAFNWAWETSSAAAWQTARDTGALSYMPYAEVQKYADLYQQQSKVDVEQDQLYDDSAREYAPIAELGSDADISTMPPQNVTRMMDATAMAYTHMLFLQQEVAQLDDLYKKTLAGRQ